MIGDVFFESLLKKLKVADKSDYQSICDSFLDDQVDSVMQTRISCIDTVEKDFRDGLQKFLAHQDSIWYDVFSLSQSMYQIAVDSSKEFSDYYRTALEPSKRASLQYTFIALEQIHGRSCQEFLEILYLMRLGFADGAFARWRSLFELQCTALFISQQGETIAKQFIDASFGDGQHYEWANGAVNKDGSIIKSGSFKKLFNGCNFPDESRNTWYRQYQYACLTTHASPQGTMGRIALRQSVPCVPIGQTDYGIDIPAKHAARSLALESCAFFSVCPYGNNVIHSIVLNNWADLIDEATDFAVKEGFKDPNKTDLFDSSHNKMN